MLSIVYRVLFAVCCVVLCVVIPLLLTIRDLWSDSHPFGCPGRVLSSLVKGCVVCVCVSGVVCQCVITTPSYNQRLVVCSHPFCERLSWICTSRRRSGSSCAFLVSVMSLCLCLCLCLWFFFVTRLPTRCLGREDSS